jgi:hypothetical protein
MVDEDFRVIHADFKNRTYGEDTFNVTAAPQFSDKIDYTNKYNLGLTNTGTMKIDNPLGINMGEPYSKTEIDFKFDLVNQKVDHNQEKMELIISKAMDNISYQITNLDKKFDTSVRLLEEQVDSKLSKIESKLLYYVIGSLLVPLLVVVAPFTLNILLTMFNTFAGH